MSSRYFVAYKTVNYGIMAPASEPISQNFHLTHAAIADTKVGVMVVARGGGDLPRPEAARLSRDHRFAERSLRFADVLIVGARRPDVIAALSSPLGLCCSGLLQSLRLVEFFLGCLEASHFQTMSFLP